MQIITFVVNITLLQSSDCLMFTYDFKAALLGPALPESSRLMGQVSDSRLKKNLH